MKLPRIWKIFKLGFPGGLYRLRIVIGSNFSYGFRVDLSRRVTMNDHLWWDQLYPEGEMRMQLGNPKALAGII